MPKKVHIFLSVAIALVGLLKFCDVPHSKIAEEVPKKDTSFYLNHSDSAKYVGMNTCKLCHQDIYSSFIKTGMGKSLGLATKEKSSADFSKATIYDKFSNMHYNAFWKNDSLYFKEYRLEKRDTIFSRTEKVNYIIGSGQHTNSHLQSVNGYINQMPMTYYTQKKHWDMPPGFENGFNTHFTRKIGLECMSCHIGYPDFVLGSENKFTSIPTGIDCERCHGPGSIHVAERRTGTKVDTSKFIDYSIVNPAKLSIDRQFDLCQRCHLQGNAVLKEGKSFYDFKPGQKLSDYISVFLPKYKNADEDFIMASHADRLKQSACFIKSYEKVTSSGSATSALKPYKGAMTCVTCHNPHVSVKETNTDIFNDACNGCHNSNGKSDLLCTDKNVVLARSVKQGHAPSKFLNCVNCHMPATGSTDIPHVSVHDHYIRKPISKVEKDKIKTFVGLYSINEKDPSALTKAQAYINQYDKFDQDNPYLDSATALLKDRTANDLFTNLRALIQLNFIKQDFQKVIGYVNQAGEQKCFNILFTKVSYDNIDAWTCYRIAESYYNTNNVPGSVKWFKQTVKLAPYNLDFRNKLGSTLAGLNNFNDAIEQFSFILKENPKHVSAMTNLGYIRLSQGQQAEAFRLYKNAEKIDPDYEPLLLNLAGYYAFQKNKKEAIKYLEMILKKNPKNQKAKMALEQIERFL
ncbi:MAG: tetratricopeptide repeat protein [Bacteroidota bacterium]|nr:tetratricopeptide repeat protein [Bacteroidota bacterium]